MKMKIRKVIAFRVMRGDEADKTRLRSYRVLPKENRVVGSGCKPVKENTKSNNKQVGGKPFQWYSRFEHHPASNVMLWIAR